MRFETNSEKHHQRPFGQQTDMGYHRYGLYELPCQILALYVDKQGGDFKDHILLLSPESKMAK